MRHCSVTNLIPLFGYYHLVNGSDGAMGHGAEMNGCGKCLKYLMFTFNLLSLVSCTVSFVFVTAFWNTDVQGGHTKNPSIKFRP